MPFQHDRSSITIFLGSLGLAGLLFSACGDDGSSSGAKRSNGGDSGAAGAGDTGGSSGSGKGGTGAGKGGASGNGGSSAGMDSTAGEGGDDGGGGEGTPTHEDILDGLGFDTNLGPPKDGKGAALPATYNPLRRPFGVFRPRAELYTAGLLWDGSTPQKKEMLFDDKTAATPYERMAFASPIDDTWSVATYKNGIAADVDGDGLDELFLVYYVPNTRHLEYIILDPEAQTFRTGTIAPDAPPPPPEVQSQQWAQPALGKGDFDGSGRDQIAIGYLGLYIAKVNDASVQVSVRSLNDPGNTYMADLNTVFVAGGDMDGDANDELAVTFSTNNIAQGRVRIYDGTHIVRDERLQYTDPEPGWGLREVRQAQVAIGDIDGDHLGEAVFFGRTYGSGFNDAWQVFILDDLVRRPPPGSGWTSFHYYNGYSGNIPNPFALLDWNGDGVKDAFAQYRVLNFITGATTQAGAATSTNTDLLNGRVSDPFGRPRVAIGDIDADGKEDVTVEADYLIRAFGLNALQEVIEKRQWAHAGNHTGGGWHSVIFAAGNFDRDSAVVQYDGDRELLFTNPDIVAVISSPPYHDGIGQDVDSTTSTFGTATSMSEEAEQSIGFSVGWSIGTKRDFLFGSAEVKLEVQQSFDYTSYNSREFERGLSYTTAPGEDLVVFTAVPFDVYYYTIVSSPVAEEVGTKVTINIPRRPQTIAADPDFFNDHTSDGTPKIDDSVLTHVLGDPSSYPNETDRDRIALIPGAALGVRATVPQSGSNTSTLQLSQTQGSGQSMDLEITVSWEVSSLTGPSVGGSYGFQYGYSYSVFTRQDTFYAGTVGAIPAREFADNVYSFGLMAYPMTHGGQSFARLDYWVE